MAESATAIRAQLEEAPSGELRLLYKLIRPRAYSSDNIGSHPNPSSPAGAPQPLPAGSFASQRLAGKQVQEARSEPRARADAHPPIGNNGNWEHPTQGPLSLAANKGCVGRLLGLRNYPDPGRPGAAGSAPRLDEAKVSERSIRN